MDSEDHCRLSRWIQAAGRLSGVEGLTPFLSADSGNIPEASLQEGRIDIFA